MCMVNQFEFKQITNHWRRFGKLELPAAASPRIQRLLLRLARYEIQSEYIRGKDNSIADALSRVNPLSSEPQDAKQMNAIPVHQITKAIAATDNRLGRTRIVTTTDPTLNQLHYIFHG